MIDRSALLEIALNSMPEGIGVLDRGQNLVLWNAAAEAITGFAVDELNAAPFPPGLTALLRGSAQGQGAPAMGRYRGTQLRARHKLGQEISVIARHLWLQDTMDEAIGAVVLFHPAERLDALPCGQDDEKTIAGQAEFEERLFFEFEDCVSSGQPLGIIWVSVDQSRELRKTHGVAACQAMLEKVQHALTSGLRPTEELGRWSEDDFLILAHERTPEMLARHAASLAGLARTADFRWWGDRISLTVSVGAAQAHRQKPLQDLLEVARKGMETSLRQGGNRVTCATESINGDHSAGEDLICTPS